MGISPLVIVRWPLPLLSFSVPLDLMKRMQIRIGFVDYIDGGGVDVVSSCPEACEAGEFFGFEELGGEGIVGNVGFVVAFGEGEGAGVRVGEEWLGQANGFSVCVEIVELWMHTGVDETPM